MFLLSGGGRTLQNLIDRIADGTLPARIVRVVSSRSDAGGLARARAAGIPAETILFDPANPDADSSLLTAAVDRETPDLVCMGGFMHRWAFPQRYLGKVINIHPGLLPKYGGKGMYGMRVHKAVLAAGEKESGCTVHFCDLEYDHGPTILERRIPVQPGDTPGTLGERVFREECRAYPDAIRALHAGRVRWVRGKDRRPVRSGWLPEGNPKPSGGT